MNGDSDSNGSAGVFRIMRATSPLPLIIDSPHSGRTYPEDFCFCCAPVWLRRAEDNHVDELVATAPDYGAHLLCAEFPRTYIDVNRSRTDIDPAIVDGVWPEKVTPSSLSKIGYGLVRRLVRPGMPVYDRPLSVAEIGQRIHNYYDPYHAALEQLVTEAYERHRKVWHMNMHAMPSVPLPRGRMGRKDGRLVSVGQPDFVLGDRDGTSCAREFTMVVRDILVGMGYGVAVNNPYKGVEIVRRTGQPHKDRHSLQVEINKALYWDEEFGVKSINFNALKNDIQFLISQTASYVTGQITTRQA